MILITVSILCKLIKFFVYYLFYVASKLLIDDTKNK